MMNAARIHDKQKLRSFWEKRIIKHTEHMDEEENRMRSSSLSRLREQWLVRLDQRNQHQQSFFEERIRRAQKTQQSLRGFDSSWNVQITPPPIRSREGSSSLVDALQ